MIDPKEEEPMTTKTETNPTTAWAEAAGRRVAEARAAREAQHQAEAETAGARRDVPVEILTQRFAEVAARVVALVHAYAIAAELRVIADTAQDPTVALRAPTGVVGRDDDRLRLHREDDTVRVTFASHARSDETFIDLAAEPFEADPAAHRIAARWLAQLDLREGGPHVTR
jgi:hypothetical protein